MSLRGLNNSDSDSDSEFIEILNQLTLDIKNIVIIEKSSANSTINNKDMAVPVLKKEYIDMVPDFHGESELLHRFIEVAEKLVAKFYNFNDPNDFQNEYLMGSILAKVKGQAAANISTSNIKSFQDLKSALLNSYGDKRDHFTLNIELTELKQEQNESPFDFYHRLQKLLNAQLSYLQSHLNAHESAILCEYFRQYALRILLKGLKEPIGSLMRTKNPIDLNSALSMLTNDFQFLNKQNTASPSSNLRHNFNNKFNPNNKFNFKHDRQNMSYQNLQSDRKTFPQLTYRPNVNQASTSNYFNRNPNRNGFQPNQRQNFSKPTPMSISTNNTSRPNQNLNYNRFSTQQFPKHVAGELNNINENGIDQVEYSDEIDFLEDPASGNPSNL